ncbi:MAG TPA: zinc-ribbon domain-containing protein [Candidatus Caccousia avistercoris]|nr:zinc-ribbon domain-containing protein [Candidatus Caccousia avistercoris]
MGLLEDVAVNAKSAVTVVGKTAGKLVDISKLRISAAQLNSEISKRYESLGRMVYDAQKTGNDAADLVKECVGAIDDLYEQLDAVNEQISAIRNRTICKNCGEENPQTAIYCSKCGKKLEEFPEEETPSAEDGGDHTEQK